MSGRARYLAHGEELALEVRRHIAVLLGPFFLAIGGIVAASALGAIASPREGSAFLDQVVGVAVIGLVLWFIWRLLTWYYDRILVTDQRIFEIRGVFTRSVASMPLAKVTDMVYHRSFGGLLLGYGELRLESAGQEQGLSRIHHLPDPDHFYRTITTLVSDRNGSRSNPFDGHLEPVYRPRPRPDEDDTGPLPRVTL